MKQEAKGLYTLKHISTLDKVETPIGFITVDGKEKEKLTLTEIDSFTLGFDSKENMLFYMQKLGYKFYNSKFIIEYRNNNKIKRINPVFSNQETLKQFAFDNQGSYRVKEDDNFYRYLNDIIYKAINNKELIRYLRKNNYISSWLYENIAGYITYKTTDVESSHIYITRIKEELSKYRIIRDIEVGIKEYEKEKEFKDKLEERKKVFIKSKKQNQGQLFNPDNY